MLRLLRRTLVLSLLAGTASVDARPPPPSPPLVEETLTTAREVAGVRWPAGARLHFQGDTRAFAGGHVDRLAAPWKVGGVTWPVDTYLELDEHGEVRSASRTLVAAETVGGVPWPAGTRLAFEGSGRITLAERRSVAGETVGGHVFPAGAELVLDAQGKLRSARVQGNDEVFAGVRWKRATLVMVAEDGQITASRTLVAREEIGKVRWPAGSTLDLNDRGEIVRGFVHARQPMRFGGVAWPAHTDLRVTAEGKVTEASITSLPEPTVIRGKRYDEHMWISFDPATGKVTRAWDPRAYE
jgi:hypothetical protein